jgi:CRISPR-associated protein Csm1
VQLFLQGKLAGIERFISASGLTDGELVGRCRYVSLLTEIIPRALLHRFHLAQELLGTSGGGQFLLVLPSEFRAEAEEFLRSANGALGGFTKGLLELRWSMTENLGDWSDIRKRLAEQDEQQRRTPLATAAPVFEPFDPEPAVETAWFEEMFQRPRVRVGWDANEPALIALEKGDPQWAVGLGEPDGLPVATHLAMDESGSSPASCSELAARAAGRPLWGVLRGDIDEFGVRLRRAQTVEEHIQFSVLFRRFFAGELHLACCAPEYWRKVSILYTGGDDFAVCGAWDALLSLSRELHRLFHRTVEEFLREAPGPEGKTISMALAFAPEPTTPLSRVWTEAGRQLAVAKTIGKDSISVLGRVLEWKQLSEAAELKDTMIRLIRDFGTSPRFLAELSAFYRETDGALPVLLNRNRAARASRPWRFHRRLSRVLESTTRHREFQKVKAELLGEFIRKNQSHVKLRPAGRVALEWARLASSPGAEG